MADEENEGAEKEGKEKPKKSGPPMLIIIIVAALLVVGGGAFAYFKFFAKGDQKAEGGHAETKKEEVKDPKELMLALDPFVVNLGGPGSFLKMTIQVEINSPLDKPFIEARLPVIRDSIVILLSAKSAETVVSPEGKMKLKDEINIRINKALGKNLVKNVYYTEFVMQ